MMRNRFEQTWRAVSVAALLLASFPGCAWFQQPPAPPIQYGSMGGGTAPSPAAPDSTASAAADTSAAPDTSLAEAPIDSTGGIPPEAIHDETWDLRGEPLVMTQGDEGQVLDVGNPVITHEGMTISAEHGLYMVDTGVGRLTGNVVFLEEEVAGQADRAVYDRGTGVLTATGHVEITSDTLFVTADRLVYIREAELAHLTGGVQGWQGSRRMNGREAKWDRNAGTMLLTGAARVRDEDENSWIEGHEILYDLETERARVTGEPHLVMQPESGGMMRIGGDRLWIEDDGSAYASGNVVVRRGLVTGYADSAVFRRDEGLAVLMGAPRVEETNGIMTGDTLYLRFDDAERLDRVEVEGNAFLRYAPQDSLKKGEVSTVTGDFLTMFFDGDLASHMEVVGNAVSQYTPSPRAGADEGTNAAQGDTIAIYLDNASLSRVSIRGNVTGTYAFDGGAPDSTAVGDSTAVETGAELRPGGAPGGRRGGGTSSPPDSGDVVMDGAPTDSAGVFVGPDGAPADSLGNWAFPADSASALPNRGVITAGRETVEYKANEVTFVLDENTVYMEGEATADYGPLTLTAGRILFHADRKYIEADDGPVLTDRSPGVDQQVQGERMDYNLNHLEGTIDGGLTTSDGHYVTADRLRQIDENDFLAHRGSITTCNRVEDGDDAHFHFGATQMRVYLNDKMVAKPIVLYVRDVPVFAFPFFVQSIGKGRRSGFLTPNIGTGVGTSRFIQNLGYYWAMSDYMDLEGALSYFQEGNRFTGRLNWRYAWRKYQMRGNFNLQQLLDASTDSKDFTATHEMTVRDWKITGRGEFRDADYRRDQPITSIGQTVDRILDSDISMTRSFPIGGSVRLSLSRREDLDAPSNDLVDEQILKEQLPTYNISLNSRPIGREGDEYGGSAFLPVFSNTRFSFSSNGGTLHTITEDTVFDTTGTGEEAVIDTLLNLIDERESSAKHRLSVTDRRKVLGSLNFGPNFTATEHWVDREFTPTGEEKGFHRAATWNASVNAGTQMFGTAPGIGPLQAVRHTFEPSATFTYAPEFSGLRYTDDDGNSANRYPGVTSSEQQFLSLSATNRFQAKVLSDGETRRVDLFNWGLRTSYNILAEENPWSNISSSVNFRRIYGVSLNLNSDHDPYEGFRARTFQMTGAFSLGGTLPGADAGVTAAGSEQPDQEGIDVNSRGGDIHKDSQVGSRPANARTLGWSGNFSFSYNGSRVGDDLETRATLNSNLSVQLTRNWSITYGNQWRISDGDITGETFSLRRDLHCWEAMFQGNRVGDNTTFYIRINIKDLPDFKVEQGRQGAEVGGLSNFLP